MFRSLFKKLDIKRIFYPNEKYQLTKKIPPVSHSLPADQKQDFIMHVQVVGLVLQYFSAGKTAKSKYRYTIYSWVRLQDGQLSEFRMVQHWDYDHWEDALTFFYSFEKIHFWFSYHHVKGTPYKHQKFSNLTEAENFIVENNTTNGTKKENEDKENHYEKILNPDKKPKLELLHGGDQPSGENLKARKVSKT